LSPLNSHLSQLSSSTINKNKDQYYKVLPYSNA